MNAYIVPMALLCILIIGSCAPALAQNWPVAHPLTDFGDNKENLKERLQPIQNLSDQALQELYRKGMENSPRGEYQNALRAAVGLWETTQDSAYRSLAVSACQAALGDFFDASDEGLLARISERGGADRQNTLMRDACHHFALLYHLTKDREYARKAALLLSRFAQTVPEWPIYNPHHGPFEERSRYPQREISRHTQWDMAGVWGVWIYQDLLLSMPLLEAYDLIYDAGVMQETGRLDAVQNMLESQVELQFGYGPVLGNMDPTQMRGILPFAKALGRPDWVHTTVKWIQDIYKTQFYADGWWHEGTPSYHKQAHHGLQSVARTHLQGYSDPEGFTGGLDGARFENLDLNKILERPFQRADHVLNAVQQPNRICQVIHDTSFPQPVWWTPPMEEAHSYLFGCAGHAILGAGKGTGNMTQASLHFGGTHGHEHYDCLNLILFAKGKELISETRYRAGNAENTTREWHTMTAGHVTVVVDEQDQTGRGSPHTPKREPQPEDAVPGIPDWRWRWSGHGNVMNDGKLRLFNTDFDRVQVVEADGERSYGSLVNLGRYRRTIALVKINATDIYVVDIFRVKGGTTHDYMLHANLDFPHTATLSLPLENNIEGTLHKYISNLKSTTTHQDWTVTFSLEDGSAALKTFFLPQEGTEIICGDAPAMRRTGTAPFLAVRQSDGESIFVAVHHPYTVAPLVHSVEWVPLDPPDNGTVAIRVHLPDRTDTILSTADDAPGTLRKTSDGVIEMRGRFAHIAEGTEKWTYLIGGDRLKTGETELNGKISHTGLIYKTERIETGDTSDAFLTRTGLPADGSLDGRTLMLDLGGLLVQSFQIKNVQTKNGQTRIASSDEPGMTVHPNLTKLEYFPNWGIQGQPQFTIAGSALLRADAPGQWRLTASGNISATAGGKPVPK
ncbi:MAG: heparinase II/III family protein [bacterium]|nr:heparinase II/III family protein [bacterium]